MKRIKLVIVIATLASIAWIAPARAVSASAASLQASPAQKPPREQPSQPPAPEGPNNAQQPDQPQGQNQRQAVMLTGQIQQQNGEYVLSDSGVNYRLDQQGKVKRFEGQKVKVTGTLDMATNMVHISQIEPAA